MSISKVKYRLKQFICLGLSVLTLSTSIPFSSYAVDGNGGGTGSGGGFTQGGGSGSYFSLANKIGYRFTIVDNTGKTVSKVNGQTGSLDVLWGEKPSSGVIMKTTKFQDYSESSSVGWHKITLSEAMTLIRNFVGPDKAVPDMIAWVDTARNIHGEQFKQWMISNETSISDIGEPAYDKRPNNGGSNSGGGGSGGNKMRQESEDGVSGTTHRFHRVILPYRMY